VTDAVHAKGGFIYCQLWHVGRASVPSLLDGNLAHASSDIPITGRDEVALDGTKFEEHKLHVMTIEDIQAETQVYVEAAKKAIEAGFDGVEIHG
jgi:2,4-dienoyl-CoA reductase-like NADH-dependent reductase (Old Yellow Enzyme family)